MIFPVPELQDDGYRLPGPVKSRTGRPLSVRDGKKVCPKCKETKSVTEFYRDNKAACGYQGHCKSCRYGVQASKEYHREYNLKRKYDITVEEYSKLFEDQDGRCAICTRTSELQLCVDHDHATGDIRGLLCRECNFGLGKFGDSIETLTAAIAYLVKGGA